MSFEEFDAYAPEISSGVPEMDNDNDSIYLLVVDDEKIIAWSDNYEKLLPMMDITANELSLKFLGVKKIDKNYSNKNSLEIITTPYNTPVKYSSVEHRIEIKEISNKI